MKEHKTLVYKQITNIWGTPVVRLSGWFNWTTCWNQYLIVELFQSYSHAFCKRQTAHGRISPCCKVIATELDCNCNCCTPLPHSCHCLYQISYTEYIGHKIWIHTIHCLDSKPKFNVSPTHSLWTYNEAMQQDPEVVEYISSEWPNKQWLKI